MTSIKRPIILVELNVGNKKINFKTRYPKVLLQIAIDILLEAKENKQALVASRLAMLAMAEARALAEEMEDKDLKTELQGIETKDFENYFDRKVRAEYGNWLDAVSPKDRQLINARKQQSSFAQLEVSQRNSLAEKVQLRKRQN